MKKLAPPMKKTLKPATALLFTALSLAAGAGHQAAAADLPQAQTLEEWEKANEQMRPYRESRGLPFSELQDNNACKINFDMTTIQFSSGPDQITCTLTVNGNASSLEGEACLNTQSMIASAPSQLCP